MTVLSPRLANLTDAEIVAEFIYDSDPVRCALEKKGIVFIGPAPHAIAAMGDKIESKRFATAAGVNTVPGYVGLIENVDEAEEIAEQISYPVMIKATAGGGGKGMRVARNRDELREGFERARSEARSAFADDRVFVEKFITDPRHIEIQVLADTHGHCIHLGERECSIQRRNQKVVEEAPSIFVDDVMRSEMGAQAIALAHAVSYRSAGTVEFIVDSDRNFYFLEMNTRLQVEHPVTELTTGIDIVEQMVRIAAGERLTVAQRDVSFTGWAVECRIYAEDPYREFLPSAGRLVRYKPPDEIERADLTIRNDTGVVEGSEVSLFYDPMLAKLCSKAPDRRAAIESMANALDAFVVDGISHNIPFLSALMNHVRWREGRLSTAFIEEEYPQGFAPLPATAKIRRDLALIALSCELVRKERLDRMPCRLAPHGGVTRHEWVVRIDNDYLESTLLSGVETAPRSFRARVAKSGPVAVKTEWCSGDPVWRGRIGRRDVIAQIRPVLNGYRIDWRGHSVVARVLPPPVARLDRLMPVYQGDDTSKLLQCPMPGVVLSIEVDEGQEVKAGEKLAVVEAMKMENVLRAERDLKVSKIHARPGDSLAVDATIMEFG